MAQTATSRDFFGFLPKAKLKPGQKRNLFGFSKKEKTARRKHVAASATHKSDESFSEWMDRKDFGGKIKSDEKSRLANAFSMGFDRGKKELESKEAVAVRKEEKRRKKKEDAKDRMGKRSAAKKSGIASKGFWTAAGLAADEKWNPAWGYGIYQGSGFATRQLAHAQRASPDTRSSEPSRRIRTRHAPALNIGSPKPFCQGLSVSPACRAR